MAATSQVSTDDTDPLMSQLGHGPRRINHACVLPESARNFLGPRRRAFWPGVIMVANRIHRRASTVTPTADDFNADGTSARGD